MDAEIGEHGVRLRFPAANHFDVVTVHIGAEEGSGSPRAERPSGELSEGDGVVLGTAVELGASVVEGAGDGLGGDMLPSILGVVEEGGEAEGRLGLPVQEFAGVCGRCGRGQG